MKPAFALFPLLLAAGLAACSPAEDAPDPGAVPVEPTLETPVEPSFPSGPEAGAEAAAQPVDADPLALTAFTPATNEIYCSFFTIGDDGLRHERVFVTEIAGVPAPAHVGIEGEAVALTQVSKAEDASPQVWVYENAERGLQIEMHVTETAKGFESREYEGTATVTKPAARPVRAISGTCGV
jgi:hypothetical protein